MPIELHCHSTASDGYFNPSELIDYAAERGISHLCLTDHDTVAGYDEAAARGRVRGVEVLAGIEIEIAHPSGAFHLLGLNIRDHQGVMDDVLPRILEDRERRNKKIAKKMGQLGVPGEYRDVAALAEGGIVGRPHFARYLIQKGYAADFSDAFDRFLGNGQQLYEPRQGLDLAEAVDKIHRAGGIAVIAHPASLRLSWSKFRVALGEWKDTGLDGIEAYHGALKRADGRKFQAIAEELDLVFTAGSDFHTPENTERNIGHHSLEQFPIEEEFLSRFQQ